MKMKIEIKLDNAAFEDTPGFEAGRILEKLAEEVKNDSCLEQGRFVNLFDINGNPVGEMKVI